MTAAIQSKMICDLVARFGVSKLRFQAHGQAEFSPLPKLPAYKSTPNVVTEECVSRMMTSDKLLDVTCKAYAQCLGLWCAMWLGAGRRPDVESAIGDSFDGTQARAAWDLDGYSKGVKSAIHWLVIDSKEAESLWLAGYHEGLRLLNGTVVGE